MHPYAVRVLSLAKDDTGSFKSGKDISLWINIYICVVIVLRSCSYTYILYIYCKHSFSAPCAFKLIDTYEGFSQRKNWCNLTF